MAMDDNEIGNSSIDKLNILLALVDETNALSDTEANTTTLSLESCDPNLSVSAIFRP
jgi:hypothetical protein